MSAAPIPFRRSKLPERRCPICGAPALDAFRPFCSRRCADRDLAHWLNEDYRVTIAGDDGDDDAVDDAVVAAEKGG